MELPACGSETAPRGGCNCTKSSTETENCMEGFLCKKTGDTRCQKPEAASSSEAPDCTSDAAGTKGCMCGAEGEKTKCVEGQTCKDGKCECKSGLVPAGGCKCGTEDKCAAGKSCDEGKCEDKTQKKNAKKCEDKT